MADPNTKQYDYISAGFSPFLTRSIDDVGGLNLDGSTDIANVSTREINYDQSQMTGSYGSIAQFGNVQIDGVKGRVSIYDDNGNEVLRLGELDD